MDVKTPVKITAELKEHKIFVHSSPEEHEEFTSRGYGLLQDDNLVLTFYEALYLQSKEIIKVVDEKSEVIPFKILLKVFQDVDENAWAKYLIYRDLRSRGYVVKEGFGLGVDFRVYDRGGYGKETAKYLIFGVQEGQPLLMDEMTRVMRYVQGLKKKLILAVINRRGETVYYSLSKLALT